jgi:hypothetical protein
MFSIIRSTGLPPRILQHPGVLVDLATAQGSQTGGDVSGQAAAANDQAEDLALGFDDLMRGDVLSSGNDQDLSSKVHTIWAVPTHPPHVAP